MKYCCNKCRSAIESKKGYPTKCECGSKSFTRAERDRIIDTNEEVYRINGDHFVINSTDNTFTNYKD